VAEHIYTVDLDAYRGQNRLLLVFAPSLEDSRVLEQKRLLELQEAEMEERDLLIFYLFPDVPGELGGYELESEVAGTLRERFNVREDAFTVLLIGKDGTEKERSEEPVPPESLFAKIDRMPMRQQEARERDQ